jgi:hypothetical protein
MKQTNVPYCEIPAFSKPISKTQTKQLYNFSQVRLKTDTIVLMKK